LLPSRQPERVRTCRCCGFVGPESLFKKSGNGAAGRSNLCKPCDAKRPSPDDEQSRAEQRARARRRYWRNVEASRERSRAKSVTPRGRATNRAAVARYRARHPEREAARLAATKAAKRGEIVKPATCQAIGCTVTEPLHKHHPSYAKPLDVVWLCRPHHEHVHHVGPLRLKPDASRKIARAPKSTTQLAQFPNTVKRKRKLADNMETRAA
jgi:hypothetical protein